MGRGQSNNADYYKHSTSMRNHRKVKILRNKFGMVLGYAFWSMMLEFLAEQDGLEWEYSEIEIETFASELGISAAEITAMVDFCVRLELLFIDELNFIKSESLNESLEALFIKRKREREKSKVRQRREGKYFVSTDNDKNSGDNSTSGEISAAETPLIRLEYIRDNSKELFVMSDSPPGEQTNQPIIKKNVWIETFDKRKDDFKKSLYPYTKTKSNPEGSYPVEMVKAFFECFSEPNKSRSKMRWESEKTWDLNLRLSRWSRNDFSKNKTIVSDLAPAVYQAVAPLVTDHKNRAR